MKNQFGLLQTPVSKAKNSSLDKKKLEFGLRKNRYVIYCLFVIVIVSARCAAKANRFMNFRQ
jgi:hypothetical protein